MMTIQRCMFLAVMGSAAIVGCRTRGGDGSNGGELSAEQQAAVDAVVVQVEAAAKALSGVVEGFAGIDATSDGTYGTCPVVTTSRDGSVVSATLEFPEGCESEYYDAAASGIVALEFDLVNQSLGIRFDDFSLDGQGVTGSFTLQLTRAADGGRVLTGTIDITTTDVGSTAGDVEIRFNLLTDTITIETADLTVTEAGGDTYTIAVADVVMRPVANGGFIPEGGTVTFEIPNTDAGPDLVTIVITYLETTPEDGVVEVKVNSLQPVEYQLPGVGGS